jgi:hypothetical protein
LLDDSLLHNLKFGALGNGIQDANEPGMQGIAAILVDGRGVELDRTETDGNGLYLFEGLLPGTYAVKFDIPEEYLFTPPAKTTILITDPVDGSLSYEDVTSDVNVDTGVTAAVFLSSGKAQMLPISHHPNKSLLTQPAFYQQAKRTSHLTLVFLFL